MKSNLQYLHLEVTTRCNFDCGFCCGRKTKPSDFEFDQFQKMIDMMPNLKYLLLQGEGEPLLHPRFFDMAKQARQRGIRISFTTNGSLFDCDRINLILTGGFESINVSLESADPEIFKETRDNHLEKISSGIRSLLDRKKERPSVGFCVTLMKDRLKEVEGIIKLYKKMGLDGGIHFQVLQRMAAYTNHYSDELKEQMFSFEEEMAIQALLRSSFKWLGDRRLQFIGPPTFNDEIMSGFKPGERSCPFLEKGIYINSEGMVTACCRIKDIDKFKWGVLGKDSLEEMAHKYDKMHDELRHGSIPKSCKNCYIAKLATMSRFEIIRYYIHVLIILFVKRNITFFKNGVDK